MKNYSGVATNHIGRTVLIHGIAFALAGLSADKTGKLKNGADAPYIIAKAEDGTEQLLHPRTAVSLFTKGESAGIKMLVDAVVDAGIPVAPAETIHHPDAAPAPTKAVVAGTSKKAQALAIFNEVVAAKGLRSEVIKRFQTEVGLSLNGANTYYQNCRGGLWE